MKSSREEDLFQKAVAAYEANDLKTAYEYFLQIVEMDGDHRPEAEQYLKEINRRWSIRQGIPKEPLPMAPAPPAREPDPPPPPPDLLGGPPPIFHAVPSLESVETAAPQILRRTPHMDLDPAPPVDPGARLKVAVYTDTEPPREGEDVAEIVIPAPPDQTRFNLTVWLVVSEPFEVEGPAVQPLTILRDEERSKSAEFTVVRKDSATNAGDTGPVTFSALFAYQGRACGRVSRAVPLAAGAPAEPAAKPLPPSGVSIEATAQPADLNVQIIADPGDERLFQCKVQTPHLPQYKNGQTEPWRLRSLAADLVKEAMARFTAGNSSDFARTKALLGAGVQFFKASPALFQKVFWELMDAGKPLRTISIVTEEPSIPWELMVPTRLRDGVSKPSKPLGTQFLVSRWTAQSQILPPQRVPLRDAYVVAPADSDLANAQEEADMVVKSFAGERIEPPSIQSLDQFLGRGGRTLLHFICHGKSGEAGSQVLVLQGEEELDASMLQVMDGVEKAFRTSKPLVFLNACEVGRQEPALVGSGGFAEAFMSLGASGVIAPLWSVKDSIAHQLAVELYQRIEKEPETPFAEILRDLRKRSYADEGGEDTWAAYCFYGDPLAARGA